MTEYALWKLENQEIQLYNSVQVQCLRKVRGQGKGQGSP